MRSLRQRRLQWRRLRRRRALLCCWRRYVHRPHRDANLERGVRVQVRVHPSCVPQAAHTYPLYTNNARAAARLCSLRYPLRNLGTHRRARLRSYLQRVHDSSCVLLPHARSGRR